MGSSPWIKRFTALCIGTLLALAAGEFLVRWQGVASKVLAQNLYYQVSDLAVHQVSDDPVLHYELRPSSTLLARAEYSADDPRRAAYPEGALDADGGRSYQVSINRYGARGPAFELEMTPGTFRVLVYGASTIYGAGINDDETLPYYLGTSLNSQAPEGTEFEAWNLGVSGYTMAQICRLARRGLATLEPDLIIVVQTNRGRRPFLGSDFDEEILDHEALFAVDPWLWLENFAPPDGSMFRSEWPETDGWMREASESSPPILGAPERTYLGLLGHSHLFRALYLSLLGKTLQERGSFPYGDIRSELEARTLYRESREASVPILFVSAPGDPPTDRQAVFEELPEGSFLPLNLPDRGPAFYDAHPPPHILAEHAGRIAERLREDLLVPVPRLPASSPTDLPPGTDSGSLPAPRAGDGLSLPEEQDP